MQPQNMLLQKGFMGKTGFPSSPAPTGDLSYDLLETKIPPVGRNHERNEKKEYYLIVL